MCASSDIQGIKEPIQILT